MSVINRRPIQRRILTHHLPLLIFSTLSVAALYDTRPYRDVLSRASFATAYPPLVLVATTLMIGPWNILRRKRNPISGDFRRDVGIWAGALGLVHSAIGQNVHLRGRPWLYYVYARKEHHAFPVRHDLFGFANYTGAASALILIALLATSNDYSLRKLGTPNWKQLQRWNYAIFALAAVHTIAYQASERQSTVFVVTAVASISGAIALQTAGFLRRRKRSSPEPA
jgi:methionine sulfoxide reductase heme-binding subunit